jgi:hypothetical protein
MIEISSGARLLEVAKATLHDVIRPQARRERERSHSSRAPAAEAPAIVYVTFWFEGAVRGEGASHYLPLEEGVRHATRCALDVPVEGRLLRLSEIPRVTLELHLRTGVREVASEEEQAKWLKLGNSGVSMLFNGGWFDLLPRDATRAHLDSRAQRAELVARASLGGKRVTDPVWHVSGWAQWVQHEAGCHEVVAGRALQRWRPSIESCRASAASAAERLLEEQDATGKYTYDYLPLADTGSNDGYNLVRLAGTTFAMSLLAATATDPQRTRFELSAQRALGHLLQLTTPARHARDGLFIANGPFGTERYEGKLGTSALTLLALQVSPFRERYADERVALIRTITGLQHPDGSLACTMPARDLLPDHRHKSCQNYFAGEALLAFAHELKAGPHDLAAACMVRAFPYYRSHFSRAPHTAFVLWQTSAWVLFHELMRSQPRLAALCETHGLAPEAVAAMVFDQADFIIGHQHTRQTTAHEAFVGGFPSTGVPGSVSSCYVEAVVRAAQLANEIGDRERAQRYRESSLRGLEFLHRLQVKPAEAYRFARPERAVGGITSNLQAYKLRIDRDQHAITAFLAAADNPWLF